MHKLISQQEKLFASTGEKYKVALFTTDFWFKTVGWITRANYDFCELLFILTWFCVVHTPKHWSIYTLSKVFFAFSGNKTFHQRFGANKKKI